MPVRRIGPCIAIVCLLGLILGAPLAVRADLVGLDYSVSENGDSVTIDGETFPVAAIPQEQIEGEYGRFAQFTRGLAIDGRPDKLISCGEMWSYNAYGGSFEIDGAACVLEHGNIRENAILCDSVFSSLSVSYRGETAPTRRDIVAFATKVCGGYEIKIIHQHDTPQIEYGGDLRGIYPMTGKDARANLDMSANASDIGPCETGVFLPVGVANGDISVGAICQAQRDGLKVRLAICADEMVDHYKERELGDRSMTMEQLAIFTMVYCAGG